jgi:hypothetical protein
MIYYELKKVTEILEMRSQMIADTVEILIVGVKGLLTTDENILTCSKRLLKATRGALTV